MSASIIHAIMDLAIEDATPLFDLASAVLATNAASTEQESIHVTRQCVSALVRSEYLEVLLDRHASIDSSRRFFVLLSAEEGMLAIEDDAHWRYHARRGAAGEWITVGATSRGAIAHRNGQVRLGPSHV